MAEPFQVKLAEEARLFQLVHDCRAGTVSSWRGRSGILQCAWSDGRESRFSERTAQDKTPADFFWDAGDILDKHRGLIEFLRRADCQDWQVLYRASRIRRSVESRRGPAASEFSHYSVHIRFLPKGRGAAAEIGEGNVRGMAFNTDGLCQRIAAIMANQRSRRRLRLEGEIPVVLHAGEGAIFFHEILGHALEADYVLSAQSPFSCADLGERILPPEFTVQTMDGRDTFFSGCPIDDEGEARQNVVLVEHGVLRHFIADDWHSRRMRIPKKGHCRVEDFTCLPQPRMFGLYIMPGSLALEEVLAGTGRGVFAREFGEGWIDLFSGGFRFSAQETYLLEDGKVGAPLGAMTFRGDLRTVLSRIALIGNDFAYDKGVSHCRKNGQTVAVRVGQPTVQIGGLVPFQEHHG